MPLRRTGQNISRPYELLLIKGQKKMGIIIMEVLKIGLVINESGLREHLHFFLKVSDDDSLAVSRLIVPKHSAKRSKELLPIL
jgi:hypothetical protein